MVDLRTNLDVMPIYQMNFEHIGMTAPCSIAAIIYNILIKIMERMTSLLSKSS